MPINIIVTPDEKSAAEMRNGQLATITDSGVFPDNIVGVLCVRCNSDLVILSGKTRLAPFNPCLAGACDLSVGVRVRLVSNGTRLEITDNK